MPASHPPENQEPRTEADETWYVRSEYPEAVKAIEEQAAAEARRELNDAKLEIGYLTEKLRRCEEAPYE